ncbi:MAG TPA: alpha/beta hydrolase-fold protein [Candidatus Limnocylindria bacterium]|nr:alpha/beta hydrolase-fold protein [Candidatus Limnocylindria bacterium]
MKRVRAAPVAILAGLLAAPLALPSAATVGSSAEGPPSPPRAVNVMCPSPALGGTLPAVVYLPAGYAQGSTRYPVVYFLHGLPAGPTTYTANSFVAAAAAASGHSAIVAVPQGAREQNSDREYLDWAPDEDWPAAINRDLVRCVDHRFRTVARRSGRALVGLSAGGFGAFNIGLRSLRTFAAVEAWSGYFAATDPSGLTVLDLGSAQANRRARIPQDEVLRRGLRAHPTFIGFYVGGQDTRFLQDNIDLDRAFTADGIPHRFTIYPGGHSTSLWAQSGPMWLGLALARLDAPS